MKNIIENEKNPIEKKNKGFSLCLSTCFGIHRIRKLRGEREFENGSLRAGVEAENGAFGGKSSILEQSDFILGHILGYIYFKFE